MIKILSLALLLAAGARADEFDRIWADSSVDRELVTKYTEELYPCGASPAGFLGCLHLLNGLGENLKPAVQFVPESLQTLYPQARFRELAAYGPLRLVEIDVWAETPPGVREANELELAFNRALKDAAFAAFPRSGEIKIAALIDDLAARAPGTMNPKRVYAKGINRLLAVHDGHGRLDTLDHIQDMARGKAAPPSFGIGIVVEPVEDKYIVMSVLPESPAAAAGMQVSDRIVQIDDTPLVGKSKGDVVALLRGERDSEIAFKIRRGGRDVPEPLVMKRGPSPIKNVNVSLVRDLGPTYASIRIRGFTNGLKDELAEAIRALPADVKGVVLDLRGNAGGEVEEARGVGGLFVGKKIIYLTRRVVNGVTQEKVSAFPGGGNAITDLPLAVLIDAGSASASEMFAGAMQDHGRAWLGGVRSYGKATVQSLVAVRNYGDLKEFQTNSRFYQPLDHTNQIVGLKPDFEVYRRVTPTEDEKFALREENEVPAALPPAGAHWVQPRAERIAELEKGCLAARRAESLYLERAANEQAADLQVLKMQEVLSCDAKTPSASKPSVVTEEKDENLEAFRAHLREVNPRLPQPTTELVAWLRAQSFDVPAAYVPPNLELVVPDELECDGDEDECRLNVKDGRYLVTAALEGAALNRDPRFLSEILLYIVRDVQLLGENGARRKCSYWHQKNIEGIILQGRYLVSRGSRPAGLQPIKVPDCEP